MLLPLKDISSLDWTLNANLHECMTDLKTNLYSKKQPELRGLSIQGLFIQFWYYADDERTMLYKGIVSYLYNDTTSEVAISGIYEIID